MPVDVFQHHNRVIHHHADGQHQRQQRQGVDRETKQCNEGKSADQAHGNRDQRDDGGTPRAQEQEDDQRHQHHRFGDGLVHRTDGTVDEDRVVVGDVDRDAVRQIVTHTVQQTPYRRGQLQWVGCGLANHTKGHGLVAVESNRRALVAWAHLHPGHITQAHRDAVDIPNRDGTEFLHRLQVGRGGHVEFTLAAFDAPRWHFQIGAAQGLFHVLNRQPERGQPIRVQPDAHGKTTFTKHADIGCAGRSLQHRAHDAVGHFGQLQGIVDVGAQRQPDHGKGIGLDLGHHRFINGLGQPTAHPRHLITHFGSGGIRVSLQPETNSDLALLLAADRGDHVHPFNPGQRVFQDVGDLRLHHLTGSTGKPSGDRDIGLIDLGVFTNRQVGERHQSNQDDQQRQDRGKHRPSDRDFWQIHECGLL